MKLWKDESGAVLSAELVLLLAIVVMALVTGFKELQAAVNAELNDAAEAIGAVDQSYSFAGISGCNSSVNGSAWDDATDLCDTTGVNPASPAADLAE